ncbi:MAG: dolichyl-phosphate beta-glucosyltransferase [Vampirovibrionales bacterium]|nr:dolichyl-phosphate beta-glucosyltransferase [Vampirovibrionales bacterium]
MISLSVVIPAYNEADRLWPTLSGLAQFLPVFLGHQGFEVILVSDGSRDETERVMQRWIRHCRVCRHQPTQWQLIKLPTNQGKGAAVRAGMLASIGEYVLFMDADGATPIEMLTPLYKALQDGADVAFASRALPVGKMPVKARRHRHILGRLFHGMIASKIAGIHDSQCGFKLFKREVIAGLFVPLKLSGYLFDVEILMRGQHNGLKMSEIAAPWHDVPGSKLSIVHDTPGILRELLGLYWLRLE